MARGVRLTVRLSDEEHAALAEVARRERRTLADTLRWLVLVAASRTDAAHADARRGATPQQGAAGDGGEGSV